MLGTGPRLPQAPKQALLEAGEGGREKPASSDGTITVPERRMAKTRQTRREQFQEDFQKELGDPGVETHTTSYPACQPREQKP